LRSLIRASCFDKFGIQVGDPLVQRHPSFAHVEQEFADFRA
jgi:hypothetical protein